LERLIEHDVRFVVIGGHAVQFHVPSRLAGDLDVYVPPDADNIDRLIRAWPDFTLESNVRAKLLSDKVRHAEIGHPFFVDVLTFPPGIDRGAIDRATMWYLGDMVAVPVLQLEDLIASKRATKEDKDLADVALLEAILATPASSDAF
jgi:hypothetical protein